MMIAGVDKGIPGFSGSGRQAHDADNFREIPYYSVNPTHQEDTTMLNPLSPLPLKDPTLFRQSNYLDGKWVEAKSGKTFEVEDPATQEIIAHVPAGDKADIDAAVAAARKAFETGPWSRISPRDRQRLVWSLGDLLERHADEFAELEALDNWRFDARMQATL